MPMLATHSNQESVGKQVCSCSPALSGAGKGHKWFPTRALNSKCHTQDACFSYIAEFD